MSKKNVSIVISKNMTEQLESCELLKVNGIDFIKAPVKEVKKEDKKDSDKKEDKKDSKKSKPYPNPED